MNQKELLLEKQFYLIKYGNFSYSDVDTMPVYELEWFYNYLNRHMKEINKAPQG